MDSKVNEVFTIAKHPIPNCKIEAPNCRKLQTNWFIRFKKRKECYKHDLKKTKSDVF